MHDDCKGNLVKDVFHYYVTSNLFCMNIANSEATTQTYTLHTHVYTSLKPLLGRIQFIHMSTQV